MKNLSFIILAVSISSAAALAQSSGPLAPGRPLPDFVLPVPENTGQRDYLGLSGSTGKFEIDQIRADVVIIEIFNMYCPFCQGEAPKVNELFALLRKDPELNEQIKLIGIGVGNSPYEVDYFRKTYQVEFPLFPDEDYTIHKQSGEVCTPFFIGIKQNAKTPLNFLAHAGGFESAPEFLSRIKDGGGL